MKTSHLNFKQALNACRRWMEVEKKDFMHTGLAGQVSIIIFCSRHLGILKMGARTLIRLLAEQQRLNLQMVRDDGVVGKCIHIKTSTASFYIFTG